MYLQIGHVAIAITADMSFRTALAANFKREYKNIEFLWKQSPGIEGVPALPPAASQIPEKHLCFLVTKVTEKQHVDPEGFANTKKVSIHLGDEGDGEAACGP